MYSPNPVTVDRYRLEPLIGISKTAIQRRREKKNGIEAEHSSIYEFTKFTLNRIILLMALSRFYYFIFVR